MTEKQTPDEQHAEIMEALNLILAGLHPHAPDTLRAALFGVFGRNGFLSAEVLDAASAAAKLAEEQGQREPDLAHELKMAGITNAHALGRYLGRNAGVIKIGSDRGTTIWQLVPVVLGGAETFKAIPPRARA